MAKSYVLEISADSLFIGNIARFETTDTSWNYSPVRSIPKFYWRVRAKNLGGEGQNSAIWNFNFLQRIVLLSPANNIIVTEDPVIFKLNSIPYPNNYFLIIKKDSVNSNDYSNFYIVTDTEKTVNNLINNAKYYWWVQANGPNNSRSYSDQWNFYTSYIYKPTQPILIAPENGTVKQPFSLTLSWERSVYAETYRLQVATDINFNNIVFNDSTITSTCQQISGINSSTVYYWRVNAKNGAGTSDYSQVWSFKTIDLSFNGRLVYENSSSTPLKKVSLYLKYQNAITDSAITDGNGIFLISPVINGTYNLMINNKIPWDGVNATDALAVMKHFTGVNLLSGLHLKAADVDNSGSVNSTDSYLIMKKYTGMISSFAAGDWVYDSTSFTVNNQDLNVTIKALCTGDVNASYFPSLAKKTSALLLEKNGVKNFKKNGVVSIPVYADRDINAGAVSLMFNFKPEEMDFTGIETKLKDAVTNTTGNKIGIAWSDVNAAELKKGDPLVILKFKPKNNISVFKGIELDPASEITDINGIVISGLKLLFPDIAVTIPTEFMLEQNYPNPFNPVTTIKYSLPLDSKVKIEVFNMLGQSMNVLTDKIQSAGYYDIVFNAGKMPSGVYLYSITSEAVDGSKHFNEVKKLILLK